MRDRKQVWLQKIACAACDRSFPHDGHIWHSARTATEIQDRNARQHFYSYFWCEGLEVAK